MAEDDVTAQLFGENLKALCEQRGLSPAELGRRAGIAESIGNYTSGRTFPNPARLRAICRVLDTSADRLLGIPPSSDEPESRAALLSDLRAAGASLDEADLEVLVDMAWAMARRRGTSAG